MTEQQGDPPRWKQGHGAPPDLQRALRALQGQELDAARIARVGGKLGALLDAAPGAGTLAAFGLRHGVRKFVAARIATGVLAIGGGLALWQVAQRPAPHTRDARVETEQVARERVPTREQVAPTVVAPARSEALPVTSPIEVSAPAEAVGPVEVQQPVHVRRSRRQHSDAPHQAAVTAPTTPVRPTREDTAPEVAAVVAPAPVEPAQVAQPAPQADAGAPARPVHEPSEIELLFAARQQMPKHPRAALRALDQHASRFPDGLLAPEREVLAIEALRKLGETDEADERLRAFRAHYPESLHLRRLERAE